MIFVLNVYKTILQAQIQELGINCLVFDLVSPLFYWFDDLFDDWGFFNNTWSWDSVSVGNWGSDDWGGDGWGSGEWGSSVSSGVSWGSKAVSVSSYSSKTSWVESTVSSVSSWVESFSGGGGDASGESELKWNTFKVS